MRNTPSTVFGLINAIRYGVALISLYVAFVQSYPVDNLVKTKSSRKLKVMTLNVRNSNPSNPENNATDTELYKRAAWINRREVMIKEIEKEAPDILGLQEVLADQYDYIAEHLGANYSMHGVGRDDGVRKGEFAPVLFRDDRFQLIDSGNFWLSHTPNIPGSKYEGAGCVRICSWVKLVQIDDGLFGDPLSFLYANTHLDNVSEDARSFGSQIVSDFTHEIADGDPIILTGDFNVQTEREKGYRILINETGWTDSFADLHGHSPIVDNNPKRMTYHGFGNPTGPRLDFVFHPKEHFETREAYILFDSGNPSWVSDHYAMIAVLSTPERNNESVSFS